MSHLFRAALAATVSVLAIAAADARAGYYKSIDVLDGGFSDWDDVPVATTASVNSGTPIDFSSLKVANDGTYVYFLITFATPVNPQSGSGVFTAVDSDNSGATGFNVFGSAAIGSNFGFQNDYPFTQTVSEFNSKDSPSGGTVANVSYGASPYGAVTLQQEIRMPLAASQIDTSSGGYTGAIFTPTFTVQFYSTDGAGDTLGPVAYSLAALPEPATFGAFAAVAGVAIRRRRAAF